LTSSEIKVPTKKGVIYLQYNEDGQKHVYHVEIPKKMNVYFDASCHQNKKFILNGDEKKGKIKTVKLKKGLNKLEFYKF